MVFITLILCIRSPLSIRVYWLSHSTRTFYSPCTRRSSTGSCPSTSFRTSSKKRSRTTRTRRCSISLPRIPGPCRSSSSGRMTSWSRNCSDCTYGSGANRSWRSRGHCSPSRESRCRSTRRISRHHPHSHRRRRNSCHPRILGRWQRSCSGKTSCSPICCSGCTSCLDQSMSCIHVRS